MNKCSLLFYSLFFILQSFGQYAILKDKDGFINIREKPNAQSKIIDTLSSGKIVYCSDLDDTNGDWVPLDINRKGRSLSGYVHKSRVQFISGFTKYKKLAKNDSLIELELDSIRISVQIGKFQPKNRIIKYAKGSSSLMSIDNDQNTWGVDGQLPKIEYRSIRIKSGKQEAEVQAKYWRDLFEPNFRYMEAYFDKVSNTNYLLTSNSDGAGAYVVIWVIKNNQIINRQINIPF